MRASTRTPPEDKSEESFSLLYLVTFDDVTKSDLSVFRPKYAILVTIHYLSSKIVPYAHKSLFRQKNGSNFAAIFETKRKEKRYETQINCDAR